MMATIDYTALIQRLFAAVESNNLDEYLSFFTEKAEYKIGNAEPLIGAKGIQELYSSVNQTVQSVTHNIKNIWQVRDNIVLCQADVTYNRKDGKVFKLPNMAIIRFRSDKIEKYQAFIDASPVFTYSKLDIVMAMEASAIQGDWERFKSFLTEDIFFKIGSLSERRGPEIVAEYMSQLANTELKITGANPRGAWEVKEAVIIEMDVQANRLIDGKKIEYPAVDIFRFEGDKIREWRVYPVYSLFTGSDN